MAWILALHVFGVIFWLGSLLVITSLLRLASDEVGVAKERVVAVARRLFNMGANAGAVITVILGIWLAALDPSVMRAGWMHVKLVLVLILILVHLLLARRIAGAERDPSALSRGQFAMIHGVVSLILLGILILVFVRPFA